jgi:hypothetical protein
MQPWPRNRWKSSVCSPWLSKRRNLSGLEAVCLPCSASSSATGLLETCPPRASSWARPVLASW